MTRDDFSDLVDALAIAKAITFEKDHPLNLEYRDAIFAEAKKIAPKKRPKTPEQAMNIIGNEGLVKLQRPFRARADALMQERNDAIKTIEKLIDETVERLQPQPGEHVATLEPHYTNTYGSQPDRVGYARVRAKLDVAGALALGIEARELVVQPEGYPIMGYVCEVHVKEPLDVEIVKRRTLPLREFVRLTWKMGRNPRVYLPFLPHGFEEKHGLDFQGHDLTASSAGT